MNVLEKSIIVMCNLCVIILLVVFCVCVMKDIGEMELCVKVFLDLSLFFFEDVCNEFLRMLKVVKKN